MFLVFYTKLNANSIVLVTKQCVVEKIQNGWVVDLDRINDKLTFTCNKGFKPTPSNIITCETGKWSNDPLCERKSFID